MENSTAHLFGTTKTAGLRNRSPSRPDCLTVLPARITRAAFSRPKRGWQMEKSSNRDSGTTVNANSLQRTYEFTGAWHSVFHNHRVGLVLPLSQFLRVLVLILS